MATYVDPANIVSALMVGKTPISDIVPSSLQPQSNVPLPTPDPRGSTFVNRIPQPVYPADKLNSSAIGVALGGKRFGMDVMPTELLMHQKGYTTRPDLNVYTPHDIMLERLFGIPNKRPKI